MTIILTNNRLLLIKDAAIPANPEKRIAEYK